MQIGQVVQFHVNQHLDIVSILETTSFLNPLNDNEKYLDRVLKLSKKELQIQLQKHVLYGTYCLSYTVP